MNRYWASTRRQILIYLYSCICITTNYFINSFVINLYRYFTKPKGSYDIMLRKYINNSTNKHFL